MARMARVPIRGTLKIFFEGGRCHASVPKKIQRAVSLNFNLLRPILQTYLVI